VAGDFGLHSDFNEPPCIPEAVVAAVNAEMMRALRLVTVERGHDPRELALVAFGGAGPLHACELAAELEIRTVLVPDTAGVLSAVGLAASDERRDRVRSYVVPLEDAGELPSEGEADLRYAGQSFELTVPLGGDLAGAFHKALDPLYPLVKEIHLADYKVRILDPEAATGAKTRVLIEAARGEERWSTIGVSQNIIEASAAALADALELPLARARAAASRVA